ncbi:MAG TPA: hypothetical protein VKB12_08130 [Pyrinomonadaceae bacterium]|nr:hypothetical protein [Pyrinomonadaceae bacterium]
MSKVKLEDAPRSDSRRRFTKTLAAAFVAGAAASAVAQTPPAAKEPAAPPNPQPTPAQQQPPPKPSPVAVAYAEVARARFGEKLSAEQFESVKRDLEGNVRASDALRAYKLENSDEPDFVFGA